MKKFIDISEIQKRVFEGGPFEWEMPQDILGVNIQQIKKNNSDHWYNLEGKKSDSPEDPDYDLDDKIIVDYLSLCLSNFVEKKTTIKTCTISEEMWLNATIYLICELSSSYANTFLSNYNSIIPDNKLQKCCDILMDCYKNISEKHIRDIFRDFILHVFEYGPLWESSNSKYKKLDTKSRLFLKTIYQNKYETINNFDARYYSDGRRRI